MTDPEPPRSGSRSRLVRLPVIVAGAWVVALCGLVAWVVLDASPTPQKGATIATQTTAPTSSTASPSSVAAAASRVAVDQQAAAAKQAAAAPADGKIVGPSFDIVRVSPRGDAVVAGRAAPRADVTISDNGREIGRTRADDQGQWTFVPTAPLASGSQALTLSAGAGGGAEVAGDTPVVVVVPDQPNGGARVASASTGGATAAGVKTDATPLIVETPLNGPARVLSGGGGSAEAPGVPGGDGRSRRLGLDVVDYDDHGEVRFAGTAPAGTVVRTYVDTKPVGDAKADIAGRWTLVPTQSIAAGEHTLRVDQVTANGRVGARVELPFRRAVVATGDVGEGRLVVQPRQSLWQIARRAYGQGVRYTVIYEANKDQIRDPNRIYPGQLFSIPGQANAIPGQAYAMPGQALAIPAVAGETPAPVSSKMPR